MAPLIVAKRIDGAAPVRLTLREGGSIHGRA